MTPGKVLVIRGGALGDFILTLPLLRCVRAAFPGARIEIVGYPPIARLAVEAGLADHVERVDSILFAPLFSDSAEADERLRAYLAGVRVAVVVWRDPDRDLDRALRRTGVERVIHVEPIPPEGGGAHSIVFMMSQLPPEWPAPRDPVPRIAPPAERRARARRYMAERLHVTPGSAVALHPGSGGRGEDRNWPPRRFAQLIDALGERRSDVFLICGPADEAAAAEVRLLIGGGQPAEARGLDALDLAALLAEARAYVGNDSGVTHLAAAVGTLTVAIFGTTDPTVWAPRGRDVRVLRPPGRGKKSAASIGVDDVLRALTGGAA